MCHRRANWVKLYGTDELLEPQQAVSLGALSFLLGQDAISLHQLEGDRACTSHRLAHPRSQLGSRCNRGSSITSWT